MAPLNLNPSDLEKYVRMGVEPELLVLFAPERVGDLRARELGIVGSYQQSFAGIWFRYPDGSGRLRRDDPELEIDATAKSR